MVRRNRDKSAIAKPFPERWRIAAGRLAGETSRDGLFQRTRTDRIWKGGQLAVVQQLSALGLRRKHRIGYPCLRTVCYLSCANRPTAGERRRGPLPESLSFCPPNIWRQANALEIESTIPERRATGVGAWVDQVPGQNLLGRRSEGLID